MKQNFGWNAAGWLLCAGLLSGLTVRADADRTRRIVATPLGGRMVANEVLVRMRSRNALPQFAKLGAVEAIGTGSSFVKIKLRAGLTVDAALKQVRRLRDVQCAAPNFLRSVTATPNDDEFVGLRQYSLTRIRLNQAWSFWKPCKQIVVGIVDTGIKSDHPDLANMMLRNSSGAVIGYDAVDNQPVSEPSSDPHGHGTFCAGEVNAQTNNNTEGMAAFAFNGNAETSETYAIKLVPLRMLDASGFGEDADLIETLEWGVQHGVHVFSMSIGGPDQSDALDAATQAAWNAGTVLVAAAGNGNTSNFSYPGACPQVIAVAATNSSDQFASFSNYGSWVHVAAPGVNIRSTTRSGGYGSSSGTSMACPLVAGQAAFLWSQNPTLTNASLRTAIVSTTDALPAQTKTIANGRINVRTAQTTVKYPPLSGKVQLTGWLKTDTTPYKTGNLVRIFVFPANSTPTQESQALATTDLPLDERGVYALPSGVVPDGTYRIGIKPLTAPGLAELLPGNLVLSAEMPPTVPDLSILLGDGTRDGQIGIADLLDLINHYNQLAGSAGYSAAADINGDGGNDINDLLLVITNYNQTADFLP
jgi:thermitase